jgi:hypothetical protein
MNAFPSFSAPASRAPSLVARRLAALTAGRKLPLRITCLGEAHYHDGEQASCAYSTPRIVTLSEADSIASAIASVEFLARQGQIGAVDDSAVGFTPRLFIIVDDEQCQVLAGEPGEHGIRWCEPVASDGEARSVVADASALRGQAMREAAANRHDAARALRLRAAVLEGRLVHADWRQEARAALLSAAFQRAS